MDGVGQVVNQVLEWSIAGDGGLETYRTYNQISSQLLLLNMDVLHTRLYTEHADASATDITSS